MANEITLKLRITEDGNLEAIGKKAKKAAKATHQAANAADNYQKKQKGVAGATSNSTKAFSKMTGGIQGGLVPAYAEIAARVFALTAAFNILSRNNAIVKLEEGLEFTGRAAGRNLPLVAKSLQDITGAAVSAEAAMRSVAVGVSAGFSQEQMEGLAKVARGAATALGRDMTDALDRLTRGAAKLEPEILDELGIMVRLDEVQRNFAISVNKSESELTQFEKRMAFTNAIVEQGSKKFGDLSRAVDPSAFDQLSASLSNISKTLVGGFSEALAPIAEFLAQNTSALTGLILAYAGLVGGSILGGLTALSEASAIGAQRTEHQAKAALKGVKPHKLMGKAFNEVAESGDRSTEALSRMQRSMNMTINMTSKDMAKLKMAKKIRNQVTAEIYRQNVAQIKMNFTNALGDIQTLGLTAATKAHVAALRELQIATGAAMAQQTALAATGTFLSAVLTGVGATARFAAAALITVLPYIAIFGTLAAIAYPYIRDMFKEPDNALTPVLEENTERFEEFDNVVTQYVETIANAEGETESWIKTLRPVAGLFRETSTAINKTLGAAQAGQVMAAAENARKLAEATAIVEGGISGQLSKKPDSLSTGLGVTGGAARASSNVGNAKNEIIEADEAFKKLQETLQTEANAEVARALGAMSGALAPMKQQLKGMADEGKHVSDALNLIDESQAKVTKLMTDFTSGNKTASQVAEELSGIAISTNAAVAAFDNFNDVLSAIKETIGQTGQTLGPYGSTLDALTEGVKQIDQMAKTAKGRSAGKDKALSILKVFGITAEDLDAGETAIERVKKLQEDITKLNDRILAQEVNKLKVEQQAGMSASSALKLRLPLLLEQMEIEREAARLSEQTSDAKREAQLRLLAAVNAYNAELTKMSALENARMGRLGGEGMGQAMGFANTMGDTFKRQDEDGNTIDPTGSQIMENLQAASGPMLETLKQLSPEGEVMSAALQGFMTLTEAAINFSETAADGPAKLQAGLAMAGAAVQALGAMQQAQAKAAVSAVDREIQAEKKRDGKSAESQAKLAALEKKKDSIKRKAFEQNKKAQMASTVINTATAIMSVMDDVPAPFNFVLAGLVGAMGAAQLAAISSTAYQGAASSTASSGMPSKVSIGNRNNTVDLAKSQSARGELAYMRGESGVGGVNQFRPAFTGAKYRAAGGSAAFVVGEQGPEMFVPETPGTILPADEVQNTSTPTNVSFNINTIDASGVEDMLVAQRGNIIGMIRQAANSYGQDFVEDVDTSVFTQSAGGVSRY